MDSEKIVPIVEQLLQRKLSQIEQRVLLLSWSGQSYKDIEENTGYVIGYLRDIGSGLWKELSDLLQQRVTKKNLPLILEKLSDTTHSRQSDKSDKITTQINYFADDAAIETAHKSDWSFPSAPLSSDSLLYIKRPPIERITREEIARLGCFLRITAPRRMGKSSLLNQVLAEANHLGYEVAYINCQDTEEMVANNLDSLLRWFCAIICQQLDLPFNLDYFWDEKMGSKISCQLFLEQYILRDLQQPLVLAIDELNNILEHSQTAVDCLRLLRSFHEQSQRNPAWQKLRLILVYSPDISVSLQIKINQSPFNMGLALSLPPFNAEQVADLAARYGLNWQGDTQVKQLMNLVGGHPYLLNIAFYYLSHKFLELEQLIGEAHTPNGIYGQHLQRYYFILNQEPKLIPAMAQIVNAETAIKIDMLLAHKLASIGLVSLDGFLARPNCQLYRLYFQSVLTTPEN